MVFLSEIINNYDSLSLNKIIILLSLFLLGVTVIYLIYNFILLFFLFGRELIRHHFFIEAKYSDIDEKNRKKIIKVFLRYAICILFMFLNLALVNLIQ